MSRFAQFSPYEAQVKSLVNGSLENWPIAASYISEHIGTDWKPAFTGEPSNFEEAALSLMPIEVYDNFVKEYNEKQWGIPARELAASLCRRFDVREDDDPRLTPRAKYQGIPTAGYAALMRSILDGIPLTLDYDYLQSGGELRARKLTVFTGPIDEFFHFDSGRLDYRGQKRTHSYLPDVKEYFQELGQINNPLHAGGPHIRTLEWKHMMPQDQALGTRGTVLTKETPFSPTAPDEYEYPMPNATNAQRYSEYRARADALEGVMICGRLGEYRYYDMDQAVARAMVLARRILGSTQ